MSGTPSEAEIQTQWKATIDIIESIRALADNTLAGAGGKFDTLIQALEGEFTPNSLTEEVARIRALTSAAIQGEQAASLLAPVFYEYGNILAASAASGFGGASQDLGELMRAIYDWLHENSDSVATRAITFDTTATLGGSNVGNGAVSRLTVDENNYALESCTVEKKMLKCIRDQNSGTEKHSETFRLMGEPVSFDALRRGDFGSGVDVGIRNRHSGSGGAGSRLNNSSFTNYDSTATQRFSGWTETTTPGQLTQDTTNWYTTHPGASVDASMVIASAGGTVTVKQALSAMRTRRLDPDLPYFFRVMLNKDVGSAVGGSVTIRMGTATATVTIAALGSGWQELMIPAGQNSWFSQFNTDPFDVEIEWASPTSGSLRVDSAIFAEWDQIDGTYWFIRDNAASPTPWKVDDELVFTDTGGAPGTGKLQYWLHVAGLGYLPHDASPTITDP